MATKINAGDDAKRKDFWMVNPFQIVVREELGGRRYERDPNDVASLAVSMLEHGQRQPIEVRRIEDNRLQAVFGFTRLAAAKLIREGFDWTDPATGDVVRKHDSEFMVKCVVTDANEKTAFLANLVENAHRRQTSPIDDAHNQHRLRDQYGYSDADIARVYRCDTGKVGKLRRLLSLDDTTQAMIHARDLSLHAALDLLELPEDKRAEALCEAMRENGKVNGAVIRSTVRETLLTETESSPPVSPVEETDAHESPDTTEEISPPTPPTPNNEEVRVTPPRRVKPLSPKEIRTFWEELGEKTDDDTLRDLCKTALSWLSGKRSAKTFRDALNKIVKS